MLGALLYKSLSLSFNLLLWSIRVIVSSPPSFLQTSNSGFSQLISKSLTTTFERCNFAICAAIPTTLVALHSSTMTPDGLPLMFNLFLNLPVKL